jgi:hypothetical protein
MRLNCLGGLCNRLRALLSYRALHGSIEAIWTPEDMVSHAAFLDVFEPLHGVTFVDANGGWDVQAWAPAPDAPKGWELGYAELKPVADVRRRIGWGMPYDAVHIRRTDYLPNMASLGQDVEPINAFLEWASMSSLLYVATDNGTTQRAVKEARQRDGLRTFWATSLDGSDEQGLVDHRRNGTLADAVVDLYMCVDGNKFMGSTGSSFSDTINILRGLKR